MVFSVLVDAGFEVSNLGTRVIQLLTSEITSNRTKSLGLGLVFFNSFKQILVLLANRFVYWAQTDVVLGMGLSSFPETENKPKKTLQSQA